MSIFYDPHYVIEQVQGLGSHPAEVAKLLQSYEELVRVENHSPAIGSLNKPEKIEELFWQRVQYHTTAGEVFSKAKEELANTLRGQLTRAVGANVDHYVNQQRKDFNQAVKDYTGAVALLPTEFDSEDVANFTDEQFQAYRKARSAVAVFGQIKGFMVKLPDLSGGMRWDTQQPANLFILEPVTIEEYNVVRYPERADNPAVAAIAPEIRAALDYGIEFKLSTADEARANLREIAA